MKGKLFNLGLILSSLIGYLEWGTDNSMFLAQGELDILEKLFSDPMSVLHPLTLLPLLGQILLLITLFQKEPGKMLTYIGLGSIGLLLAFMFVIGIIGPNFKVLLSTIPFLVFSILAIRYHRGKKNVDSLN